ncbi:MOSC domain-containing protein [Pasteurellaceae bacterium HPA106]|uniref:MOSC domain-containing protein n=1 Tax=Spirabiliibacterium pneumoniae TaxID=221400 RepID=UPI001AAC9CDA|nr:MOSC N-terminal beta barrel domain-containing protein [Spirabiliibacterium pneumoniae]MBE2896602.1 MOSC domain-containing protein [Spirabiliibacterium pneumoniae]
MKFRPYVTALYLYPIKSTQPQAVTELEISDEGITFDRRFMLTDLSGNFITARKHGALYDLTAHITATGLCVAHRDGSHIDVHYTDFEQTALCTVWRTTFISHVASDAINHWFSQKLQSAVQLRWCGHSSTRRIKRYPQTALSFADGYPLLLTNQQSLLNVQQHCPVVIDMRQFRPNIVIDNAPALSELHWQRLRIGGVEFIHAKPCERCILTTRDLQSGQLEPKAEPFRTLKKHFANAQGQPLFGANLIAVNSGTIALDDPIDVLA